MFSKADNTFPTFKETQPISVKDLLLTQFDEEFHIESQNFSGATHTTNLIKKYSLNAQQFTIEVIETSIFQNNDTVLNNVSQRYQAGFKLSIDLCYRNNILIFSKKSMHLCRRQ
ncbi:hypothetical protein ABFY09_10475 [Marinomonas sp. 5E14-1]|uniref:hypothetical protein n=1 Tax=Marinomonas sp. 5E14-1 TaxID=3153922 RepID=UPI0032668B29